MIVAILDDHPIIRHGIKEIISSAMRDTKVETFETVRSLIDYTKRYPVDIAITDLSLKTESGMEYIRYVKEEKLDVRCIVFTSSDTYRDYKNALDIGANGYVRKDSLPDDLLYAIRTVQRGKRYIDNFFVENYRMDSSLEQVLTEREMDVFKCIGRGYNNSKIAEELYITKNTVKKHIGHIFSKLNIGDRSEAVVEALNYFGGRAIC